MINTSNCIFKHGYLGGNTIKNLIPVAPAHLSKESPKHWEEKKEDSDPQVFN